MPLKPLPLSFYEHPDPVHLAYALIGKVLVTEFKGERTSGRIIETEAYHGSQDRASHAYKGRTKRTEVMFGPGGRAYVYLCYGLHQMFNIVTNVEGVAHAILVRALEPLEGIDVMLRRTGKAKADATLTRGPGNVGKALGFHTSQCGLALEGPELLIADDGFRYPAGAIAVSPRIGVAYAGEDALLPYRFYVQGHPSVSGRPR
ncbi:DNA-3-methyladenine glycosylase [Flaviaesturariibacter flavus]|uniref:Putative 3-methyladenine DNA glycosylase n=1 Tax=Flaviaesturariibacter flavus TaxID=2502780 RepID=A0A4R1B8U6_9BACT|nr:DNA-3-methyladenine glycosylase [Flaviaesturariibacter flavus]TCJ13315.1 DNA-3-methyladenine glycosylase [Flaviaesturariibacter flavus]